MKRDVRQLLALMNQRRTRNELLQLQTIRDVLFGGGLKARLIRSGIGSAGVQAANRVLALVLGVLLARTLGPEGYGIYAYVFAIMGLLMVVAEAGAPTLVMREVAASQGLEEWGLLRGVLRRGSQFVALVAVIVALVGLLILWAVRDRLSPEVFYTMAVMLLMLPAAALSKTIAYGLRGLNKVVTAQALEMLLRPLMVISLVGALFFLRPELRTPWAAMAGQLAAVVIVLVIAALLFKWFLPDGARVAQAESRSRQWLKSAIPFILIGGVGIVRTRTDIIMIGWLMDAENVGDYRVAMQGAILVALSLQVVNAVVAPQFSRLYAKGDIERLQILVTRAAQFTFIGALPLALILILFGKQLIGRVFGTSFAPAYAPLVILVLGHLFHASFGSVGFLLNMTGQERASARIFCESALLNVALNAVLIPIAGIAGAAASTTMARVFGNIRMAQKIRSRLNIRPTVFARIPK